MLDAKPAMVFLDAPDVGNLLAVDPGLGAIAHHANVDLVPVVISEKPLCCSLEFCGLFRAFWVEPAAKTDSINASIFSGFCTFDLALVALRFSFLTNQAKAEAGVKKIAVALGLNR